MSCSSDSSFLPGLLEWTDALSEYIVLRLSTSLQFRKSARLIREAALLLQGAIQPVFHPGALLWRLTGGFGPGLGHCGARVGDCWGRFCLPWSGELGISTARALLMRLNRDSHGYPGAGLVRSVPGRRFRGCCFHSGTGQLRLAGRTVGSRSWDDQPRSWVQTIRSHPGPVPGPVPVQNPNPLYTIGTNHSFILPLKVPFRVEVSVDLVFLVE